MVTVATWNLENLFSPNAQFGPTTAAEFEEKVRVLAETIHSAGVDVLGAQEVGDDEAFEALVSALGAEWVGVLSTHFDRRHSIRVGFASRLPIVESSEYFEIPTQLRGVPTNDDGAGLESMGRGALRVRIELGDEPVDLVTAHLKSKLITFPGSRFSPRDEGERARYTAYALLRRAAEAAALRIFANGIVGGNGLTHGVVVMGDLNDEVEAATTQILNGPPGSEIGTAGENQPDRGDAWRLLNLAPLMPADKRYSRIFRGRRELIDHIFVSTALRSEVREVTTVTGWSAAGRAVAGGAALPSITEVPTARKSDPVSDHAMVFARLAPAE